MMNLVNKYEWIERYHAGDLTEEERTELEQMMQQDETLAHEVQLYGDIHTQLTHHYQKETEEKALRATLQTVINESKNQRAKVLKFNPKVWLMAASIALLVGIFWYQTLPPIYKQYAQHKPMDMTVRGANDELIQEAQYFYNAGFYEEAKPLFKKLSEQYPDNTEIQIYYGIALMELGETKQSKEIFTQLAGNAMYKDWAYWELSLLALKEKDYQLCKIYLDKIDEQSSYYLISKKLAKKL